MTGSSVARLLGTGLLGLVPLLGGWAVLPVGLASAQQVAIQVASMRGSSDEATEETRKSLLALLESTLSGIPGVQVSVVPVMAPQAAGPSELESLVQAKRIAHLIKVTMIPVPKEQEQQWGLTWWIADLSKAKGAAESSWPKHPGRAMTIGTRTMFNDMVAFGDQVKAVLEPLITGVPPTKSVFVSCFKYKAKDEAGAKSSGARAANLVMSRLPTKLPGLLHKSWKAEGQPYEGVGLGYSEVEWFCEKNEDPARLGDRVRAADYTIEGMITLDSQTVLLVYLCIARRGGTAGGSREMHTLEFRWDGDFDKTDAEMAKYIIRHWPRVVGHD